MSAKFRRPGRTGPLVVLAGLITCGLCAAAGPALATWSVGASGSAAGAATTMPTGTTPSVSLAGSNVTVTWTAATMANGVAVAGYIVKRYNAATGQLATIGASCSGIVTSTSCTETGVPNGSWDYTDTPVQLNWTGQESAASQPVTIGPLTTGKTGVGGTSSGYPESAGHYPPAGTKGAGSTPAQSKSGGGGI